MKKSDEVKFKRFFWKLGYFCLEAGKQSNFQVEGYYIVKAVNDFEKGEICKS